LVNGSVGIAIFPEDGYSLEELLRNADTAMYAAKADGRNTFKFFTSHMNEVAQSRLQLEGQLRQALAHQELFLHYQPFIHLPTGTIVAAECLMRWQNKLLGAVTPDEFIPIAEEMGLIIDLGEWVLRQACQYLTSSTSSFSFPKPFWIAVNISPRQLRDSYFIEMVETILKETNISPRQLELEMTEQLLLDNHPDILETLAKLAAMEISLSIDDFGTGYSSLVMVNALAQNARLYSQEVNQLRRNNPFELHSLDNEYKYIQISENRIPHNLRSHAYFHFSKVSMATFNERVCTYYDQLPLISPDFIYIDGPDQFNTVGDIAGWSTRHKDMMPMSADVLRIEHFLTPGTIMVLDGRAANARFLKCNLQRAWLYQYDELYDQHVFILDEPPLGKYNRRQLEFYKGSDS